MVDQERRKKGIIPPGLEYEIAPKALAIGAGAAGFIAWIMSGTPSPVGGCPGGDVSVLSNGTCPPGYVPDPVSPGCCMKAPPPNPTLLINGSQGPLTLAEGSSNTWSGSIGLPYAGFPVFLIVNGNVSDVLGMVNTLADGSFSGTFQAAFPSGMTTMELQADNYADGLLSNQVTLNEKSVITPQPTLSVSSPTVSAGGQITISGSNYTPGGVSVSFDPPIPPFVVPTAADATGHFSVSGFTDFPSVSVGSEVTVSVTTVPPASNQPVTYQVTATTVNQTPCWRCVRIRPIDDQHAFVVGKGSGWSALKSVNGYKDYTPDEIVSMITDVYPDELNRFISGYFMDSTGKETFSTTTLAELGAPGAGNGATVLHFLQSCLDATRSKSNTAANQEIILYHRLDLRIYIDTPTIFWQAVQNHYELGQAMNPKQSAIAFDNSNLIGTYAEAMTIINRTRAIGIKYISFGATGQSFKGSWKKGDVDIVMVGVDTKTWTPSDALVQYWNTLAPVGTPNGMAELPLVQIDFPCQMAELTNGFGTGVNPAPLRCKKFVNQNNPTLKMHSIITNFALNQKAQKAQNYHFCYHILQGLWDSNDPKYNTPAGYSMYNHMKDLMGKYNPADCSTVTMPSYNLNALVTHINDTWDPTFELWSTTANTGKNRSGGCFTGDQGVPENRMFWFSSENEITAVGMYEQGYSANALAAAKKMLSFNPWHTAYRECILYGQLTPVMKQGGNGLCQFFEKGTISSTGLYSYAVMNNYSTTFGSVSPTGLGQNGALAYQAVNDWIRGGTNWTTYINTIENEWDGIGFPSSKDSTGAYQTRALGAAGCAILICNYDPKGIFPAMNAVTEKIQWTDGSFPNGYTTAAQSKGGDAESCNRILLWDCPNWLAYMRTLKGTATGVPPNTYPTEYTPPPFLVSGGTSQAEAVAF